MKMLFTLLLLFLLLISSCVCANTNLRVNNYPINADNATIVIGENPNPQEKYVAEELQKELFAFTGSKLEITTKDSNKFMFLIGKSSLSLKTVKENEYDQLGDDGIIIRTSENSIVLTGNRRGVIYAVFDFLDDYCGIKFLAPDCTYYTKTQNVSLKDINKIYVPLMKTRAMDYYSAFYPDWCVRNKINGNGYAKERHPDTPNFEEKHGGEIKYPNSSYFWHTFRHFVPMTVYGISHPEYYSEINGTRKALEIRDKNMTDQEIFEYQMYKIDLCLTNDDVLKIVVDGVKKLLREHPDTKMLSLSCNDQTDFWCHCDKCMAIVNEDGSPSALMLNFANQVVTEVEKEFPDVMFTVLAYYWTQSPPKKMKANPKIIAEICPLSLTQAHSIDPNKSDYEKNLVDDINGWKKVCAPGQVKFCQYSINFSYLFSPMPNLYLIHDNIGKMIDMGASHFYDCGSYSSDASDLCYLRSYLIAKTAWDSKVDTDKIIDEFLSGYYGKAAKPIKKYIEIMQDYVDSKPNMYFSVYSNVNDGFVSEENLLKSLKLFDTAQELVKGDEVKYDRVRKQRLSVLGGLIEMYSKRYQYSDDNHLNLKLTNELLDDFLADCEKYKITRISDNHFQTPEEYVKEKRGLLNAPSLEVVTLKAKDINIKILSGLQGKIWNIFYKNKPILGAHYSNSDFNAGGYFGFYDYYGNNISDSLKFKKTYSNENSVKMVSEENNFRIEKEISLNKNIVTTNTKIINLSNEEQTINYRTHPTFKVRDFRKTDFYFTINGQKNIKHTAGHTGQVFFNNKELTDGVWGIDDKDLNLIQRFDYKDIDHSYVWFSDTDLGLVSFELIYKQKVLKPNESVFYTNSIEIN